MITLIKDLNKVLTKGELVLHVELSSTAIKSIEIYNCALYIICNASSNFIKIYDFSRTFKIGTSIEERDRIITQELLKFIIKGGLKSYE